MHQGMFVRSFRGSEGQVAVPGLGAVVATFQSWTLKRREENGTAGPTWTLHAVLSYQNDTLLKNELLEKRFVCVLSKDQKFELCDFESIRIEGASLLVEGVIQCQAS